MTSVDFRGDYKPTEIIIHQPISSNYGPLSINTIKELFPNKHYISFPSIYFNGYFPHLMYLRKPKGGTLKGLLGDYHDQRVIEGAIAQLAPETIIEKLCSDSGKGDAVTAIEQALKELELRESELDLKIRQYLKQNIYKEKLFYVFNHPSNIILIDIAKSICQKLDTPISKHGLDISHNIGQYLANIAAPVEKPVLELMESSKAEYSNYRITLNNQERIYSTEEYVHRQIEMYKNCPDLSNIYQFAVDRKKSLGF